LIRDGAIFQTDAAPGTEIRIDTSRLLSDLDPEIAGRTLHGFQISVGNKLYVEMPADLDQFGGNDSHGTVIGGKGLVQLGHGPPDGRGFFKEVDIVARIRQIKGRLHARDPTSDHKNGTLYLFAHLPSPETSDTDI
jgi:hypothetical protein